jgi:hypothetical protein
VSRIFLSHSSTNNAEAVALRDWLGREGWKDEIFLDLDPMRGIAAGERWERALNAANRCEAVRFSYRRRGSLRAGAARTQSRSSTQQALVRRLIEDLTIEIEDLGGDWQLVASPAVATMLCCKRSDDHARVRYSRQRACNVSNTGLSRRVLIQNICLAAHGRSNRSPIVVFVRSKRDAGSFWSRCAGNQALDPLRGLREARRDCS